MSSWLEWKAMPTGRVALQSCCHDPAGGKAEREQIECMELDAAIRLRDQLEVVIAEAAQIKLERESERLVQLQRELEQKRNEVLQLERTISALQTEQEPRS